MASLFKAFAFGMTLAIAVGPIALLIVSRSAKSGIAHGLGAALGASTADFVFALIAFLAGKAIAPALASHRGALRLAGSLALAAIGLQMGWAGFRQLSRTNAPRPTLKPGHHPFLTTFGLTLVNPLTVIAFVGLSGQLSLSGPLAGPMSYALAVFFGTLVVQFGLAALGAGLGATLLKSARRLSLLTVGSGIGLVAFALVGLR